MSNGRAVEELRRQWQPLDPARNMEIPSRSVQDAYLLHILELAAELPTTNALPAARGQRLRRVILAAAGAVTVGGVLVVANPAQGPAFAATPPPMQYLAHTNGPGAEPLRQLAEVARLSAPARTTDGVEHIRMESWYLVAEQNKPGSEVIPQAYDAWRAPDDSGRSMTRTGDPLVRSGSLLKTVGDWFDELVEQEEPSRQTFSAATFPARWRGRPPVDVKQLKAWLDPRGHAQVPADYVDLVTKLMRERVLTPAERAAVLELLASIPDVVHTGEALDTAGRRGQAFVLNSDHSGVLTRYTLLIDPATGTLLTTEEIAVEGIPMFKVKPGSVVSYQTFLNTE